ncbi:hypothetical protein CISIN_1g022935mg [Citrus sinensis]|uniref:Uncharacterized protein n=1 Tax=Citrus sinensis TaxID=2711 RepID=A0A067FUS9_CITSI|nr:hypothetical protein CISIN_1g022935mg [Citrus sinensis]
MPLTTANFSICPSIFLRRIRVRSPSPKFPPRFSQFSISRPNLTSPSAAMLLPQNPVLSDVCASAVSAAVAASCLRLWEETARRDLFDQKLNRKLVHISIGLIFMLCWPLFSSGPRGAILASLTPGVNIIRMLLVGSGMWKDEATVKSMSRYGDRRELLTGPLYYAITITLACVIYWRNSPNGIAAICNLCAGDGKETESLCMPVLSSLFTGLSAVQYLNLFSCKLDIKNCICTFTDIFAINYCS